MLSDCIISLNDSKMIYKSFLYFTLLFLLVGCESIPQVSEDFALIYIGSSLRTVDNTLVDPIDKNAFFIEGGLIYKELVDRGLKPKNIYFLYKDAKPDFEEPMLSEFRELLEDEFLDKSYNHEATVLNMMKLERQIQRKLGNESNFFLILDAHGLVDKFGFKIRSEHDKTYIRSWDIREMLKNNRGRNHLYIGSCYSGYFLNDVDDINARVVTAAPGDKAVWLDRDVSFGREYFKRLPRDLSLGNSSYDKAFRQASMQFQRWGSAKSKFIKEKYEGGGHPEVNTIDWAPTQKVLGKFK